MLDAGEKRLKSALGQAEAMPFLGHHPLTELEAAMLREELAGGRLRLDLIRRLRNLFVSWRTLTVAWIAGCVARDYGSASQTELWPHLDRLFGGSLSGGDRRRLGEWFRGACRALDLPVAEVEGAVDGFVQQAGVPETQIDGFVEAMLKAERRRGGLPDPDDDLDCAAFSPGIVVGASGSGPTRPHPAP